MQTKVRSTRFYSGFFSGLQYLHPRRTRLAAFNRTPCSSKQGHPYNQQAVQRDVLKLAPGQVDVWWLQPEKAVDPGLLERYLQLLTPEEQAYVSKGSSEEVRKQRLLARTLQRTTLARYYSGHRSPASLRFERNAHGKPRLSYEEAEEQPDPLLHFSLTHTSTMLGIAVSCGSLVGLDVEETARHTKADPLKLARRRLAPLELAGLEAIQSKEARAKRFVQLWTLKEAYVKAVGQGISAAPGLKGFSILFEHDCGVADRVKQVTTIPPAHMPRRISFQSDTLTEDTWGFMLINLSNKHTAALCLQNMSQQHHFARQDSADSNASTTTNFSSLAECTSEQKAPAETGWGATRRINFCSASPLMSEDLGLRSWVEGAGGI